MAALHTLPQSQPIRKSGALILSGWGIRILVQAGHLCLEDGIADERRKVRLAKVGHGLRRLICIGSEFFITGEALRWLDAQGASFVNLDRRGKVIMVCGPASTSDAKLRRLQSLSLGNGTALKISKQLISQKLTGQELLVRDMLHDSATADAIARWRVSLPSAESIESVRLIESQSARLYWGQAWSDLPIRWARKDESRVPAHWKCFGSRISPLTHSPRLAANPPNALLNLLYSILESESTIAAFAMGLLPEIGLLHSDTPSRNSLSCDLMEVCRAKCDAFILDWLQREPLRRSDFWEDRNGNCRIGSALAIKLCETSDTWRRLVAPVAEYVAQELWSSVSKPAPKGPSLIATRLTQRNKRGINGSDVLVVRSTKPEHLCICCGKAIQNRSARCADCAVAGATENLEHAARTGRVAARSPEARAKHGASRRRVAAATSAWDASKQPAWLTSAVFEQRIQPLLAHVPTSSIRIAAGVSRWYAGRIRQGHLPHPRTWQALAGLVGISLEAEEQ